MLAHYINFPYLGRKVEIMLQLISAESKTLQVTRDVYDNPERLKDMSIAMTNVVKRDVEKVIAAYDVIVERLKEAAIKDLEEHAGEPYISRPFERFNTAVLAKGVWDQILVCVNAHLAGEL